MVEYNGFLMRTALSDNGSVPAPAYPYHSPDIIGHAQVANPSPYFVQNYSSDPNQPIEKGSAVNYLYTRAKNLSANTLSGYYVSVYRANASLFMRPSIWIHNRLQTHEGESYVQLPSATTGQVVVGQKPFLLNAVASNNFCLIGIASTSQNPTVPSDFATYDDYIHWVRTNQNVCGRNLRYVQSYANRSYEQLDEFSNPENTAVPTLFQTTVTGSLPSGSKFGLTCAPLGLNESWDISDGKVRTASSMTPADFNGNVTTWATIPGGTWPTGVSIQTTVFVGVTSESIAAQYRETEWPQLGGRIPESLDSARPHLVRLGDCSTVFTTAS